MIKYLQIIISEAKGEVIRPTNCCNLQRNNVVCKLKKNVARITGPYVHFINTWLSFSSAYMYEEINSNEVESLLLRKQL